MQPGETVKPRDEKAPEPILPAPEEQPPAEESQPDSKFALPEAQATEPLDGEGVSWTASEYIAHQKTAGWFIMLGAGSAVVTLLVYLLSGGSILSAVVVLLICASIGVFGARQPNSVQYSLGEDGIHVGQKFYPYYNFKSFAVVDEEAISSIWLRPLKRYLPTVNMYYDPDEEDKIITVLDNFLPREDRDHDAFDHLSRRFRF